MSGVEQTVREVHRWLSYGTPQGLVTSARVLRHKSDLWYLVLLVLSVVRKDVDRWTSQGMTMVIAPLGTSETGKKRTLQENREYCQRFVNMVASSELDWG